MCLRFGYLLFQELHKRITYLLLLLQQLMFVRSPLFLFLKVGYDILIALLHKPGSDRCVHFAHSLVQLCTTAKTLNLLQG